MKNLNILSVSDESSDSLETKIVENVSKWKLKSISLNGFKNDE